MAVSADSEKDSEAKENILSATSGTNLKDSIVASKASRKRFSSPVVVEAGEEEEGVFALVSVQNS